jgi:hypothetical protein
VIDLSMTTNRGYYIGNSFNGRLAQDTQYSAATIQAAPAAGLSNFITDVTICCGATGRVFQLLDGATVIFQVGLAANSSCNMVFATPIRQTAATALTCTSAGASTGAFVGVGGFVSRTNY